MRTLILAGLLALGALWPSPVVAQAIPDELSPARLQTMQFTNLPVGYAREWESRQRVYGPVYGDWHGLPAAAIVFAYNGGGSGTFYLLVLVASINGKPVDVASASLGDRIIVNQVVIGADAVVVTMVEHGPQDPACCPHQPAVRVYTPQLVSAP